MGFIECQTISQRICNKICDKHKLNESLQCSLATNSFLVRNCFEARMIVLFCFQSDDIVAMRTYMCFIQYLPAMELWYLWQFVRILKFKSIRNPLIYGQLRGWFDFGQCLTRWMHTIWRIFRIGTQIPNQKTDSFSHLKMHMEKIHVVNSIHYTVFALI